LSAIFFSVYSAHLAWFFREIQGTELDLCIAMVRGWLRWFLSLPFCHCNLNPRTRLQNGIETENGKRNWTDGFAYIEIYCLIALITIRQCPPLCVGMSPIFIPTSIPKPIPRVPVERAKEFNLNYFLMSCAYTHTHTHPHPRQTNPKGRLENCLKVHLIWVKRRPFSKLLQRNKPNGQRAELFVQRFLSTICLPLPPCDKYIYILLNSHTYSINSD